MSSIVNVRTRQTSEICCGSPEAAGEIWWPGNFYSSYHGHKERSLFHPSDVPLVVEVAAWISATSENFCNFFAFNRETNFEDKLLFLCFFKFPGPFFFSFSSFSVFFLIGRLNLFWDKIFQPVHVQLHRPPLCGGSGPCLPVQPPPSHLQPTPGWTTRCGSPSPAWPPGCGASGTSACSWTSPCCPRHLAPRPPDLPPPPGLNTSAVFFPLFCFWSGP